MNPSVSMKTLEDVVSDTIRIRMAKKCNRFRLTFNQLISIMGVE